MSSIQSSFAQNKTRTLVSNGAQFVSASALATLLGPATKVGPVGLSGLAFVNVFPTAATFGTFVTTTLGGVATTAGETLKDMGSEVTVQLLGVPNSLIKFRAVKRCNAALTFSSLLAPIVDGPVGYVVVENDASYGNTAVHATFKVLVSRV